MDNIISKSIYYVSNLGTDVVSIIDGDNLSIIEEIKVGSRAYGIVVDKKDNVYIATDRNDKITIINNTTKFKETLNIPNNGYIKVDSTSMKIYVSNTDKLCVYSLYNYELINKIEGFTAIGAIELSNDGNKLFILDVVQNEIKIYDTRDLKLIKTYRKISFCPNYILISNNDEYLYISNKNIKRRGYIFNILILDLKTGSISSVELPSGSIITYLAKGSNLEGISYLYAVNKGLGKIEVIDVIKNKVINSIKTTLEYPQRVAMWTDNKFLVATSVDSKGRGALDIININDNKIESTFNFIKNNSIPYDIGIVKKEVFKNQVFKNQEAVLNVNKNYIATINSKGFFYNNQLMLLLKLNSEPKNIYFTNNYKDLNIIYNGNNDTDVDYIILQGNKYNSLIISANSFDMHKLIVKNFNNYQGEWTSQQLVYVSNEDYLDKSYCLIKDKMHFLILVNDKKNKLIIYKNVNIDKNEQVYNGGFQKEIIIFEHKDISSCLLIEIKNVLWAVWIIENKVFASYSTNFGEDFSNPKVYEIFKDEYIEKISFLENNKSIETYVYKKNEKLNLFLNKILNL